MTTLADLIRGKVAIEPGASATAIPAIAATDPVEPPLTVARVATIAVADRTEQQFAVAETSYRWLLHFPDAGDLEICFWPMATHAGVLADYPDAVAAEPIPEPEPADVPAELMALFDECLRAGLYKEEERALLPGMVAADIEGTRALLTDRQAQIGR